MQRIAVTGATGYIGGRLVPRLLEAENRLPDISNKVGSEYMPRCSSYQAFAEVV
jgi:nucleoside-diphosphate-sugar epimerase